MILEKYEKLPHEMKNEYVKKYHKILSKKKFSLTIKRLFDVAVSFILIIILFPVYTLIAVAIKLDSRGPILFKQKRVTQNMKEFSILKFRTMVQDADKLGSKITLKNDCRITNVGKIIRKIRLDELPQLINVLKGDMSFVGTRPEVWKYVNKYTDEMKATLLLPAGLTSIASIKYKSESDLLEKCIKNGKSVDDAYLEDILPNKMKYNLEYMKKFSILKDLKICLNTVIGVFK